VNRLKSTRHYNYRRKLPHLQGGGAAIFATFNTLGRWQLSDDLRAIVLDACLRQNSSMCDLFAAVVMPDHTHVLFRPLLDDSNCPYALADILGRMKGYAGYHINKKSGRSGPVWQDESFDHVLRSDEKLDACIEYIRMNPVRAGLVPVPELYEWLWIAPVIF
jgi:REP-associated tyrosine transposase